MNLSTEEIAFLTKISLRGVEVGRYLLRKNQTFPGIPTSSNFSTACRLFFRIFVHSKG